MIWWILIAVVLVVLLLYLSSTAGRLDRMHHRVELSRANLIAALQRRRDLADHVATVGILDPASSLVVADAVARADELSQVSPEGQAMGSSGEMVKAWLAESDLSQALGAVFADRADVAGMVELPGGEVVVRLGDACRRVEIGRRFYNDAVLATRGMRGWRSVRWFRLAGTATMPETVEMVDSVPAGFAGY